MASTLQGLQYLAKQLKINDSFENQKDVAHSLLKRSNSNEVLVRTYKSMIKFEDLLSLWDLLIKNGIAIQQNDKTKTPLLVELISYGYKVDAFEKALASMLEKHGENIVNQADQTGKTPLMAAAAHGNEKITALLLQYGANRDTKNNNGQTAADIVLDKLNKNVVHEASGQYDKVHQQLVKRK